MGAAAAAMQAAGGMMNAMAVINKMQAARDEAQFQADTAEKNRAIAQGAEANVYERAEQQGQQSRLKYGNLRGEQAAAYGASGVNVNSGSALSTLTATNAMSDYDARVIRNNAAREAWGYREKQAQFMQEKNAAEKRKFFATAGGAIGATGALFGGTGDAIGAYSSGSK